MASESSECGDEAAVMLKTGGCMAGKIHAVFIGVWKKVIPAILEHVWMVVQSFRKNPL
jgi:hypothetical protein